MSQNHRVESDQNTELRTYYRFIKVRKKVKRERNREHNLDMSTSLERRRRRKPSHILMRNIVIVTSVVSAVINLVVLAISASAGKQSFELQHDKTNKMTYAPSGDSDQLPSSLIRVFVVRVKKPWILSYPLSVQRSLWSDLADAQADLSLRRDHRSFCWFVMRRLILINR